MDFSDIIYRNNNYMENLHAVGNNGNKNIIFLQQFYIPKQCYYMNQGFRGLMLHPLFTLHLWYLIIANTFSCDAVIQVALSGNSAKICAVPNEYIVYLSWIHSILSHWRYSSWYLSDPRTFSTWTKGVSVLISYNVTGVTREWIGVVFGNLLWDDQLPEKVPERKQIKSAINAKNAGNLILTNARISLIITNVQLRRINRLILRLTNTRTAITLPRSASIIIKYHPEAPVLLHVHGGPLLAGINARPRRRRHPRAMTQNEGCPDLGQSLCNFGAPVKKEGFMGNFFPPFSSGFFLFEAPAAASSTDVSGSISPNTVLGINDDLRGEQARDHLCWTVMVIKMSRLKISSVALVMLKTWSPKFAISVTFLVNNNWKTLQSSTHSRLSNVLLTDIWTYDSVLSRSNLNKCSSKICTWSFLLDFIV